MERLKERFVLKNILNLSDVDLALLGNQKLPAEAKEILERHYKTDEPLEYIINRTEFFGMTFHLNNHVLIPRPETELLAESVIEHAREFKNKKLNLLDLCTGSGCILVSILNSVPHISGTGIDICENALEIAQKNAQLYKVNASFIKNDMLNGFNAKYDIIVSNPPYIKTSVIGELADSVKNYEPHLALDGGEDGLKFYKHIRENFENNLNPNGVLFMEIGHDQKEAIESLFYGYEVVVKKDYSGHDRIVIVYT